MTRILAILRTPGAMLAALALALIAQLEHTAQVFMLVVAAQGWQAQAHAYAFALAVETGVPDVMLAVRRGQWGGLFVELKRADRRNHATAEQERWIAALRAHGYMAVVCYGCTEAQQAIMAYLQQEAQP